MLCKDDIGLVKRAAEAVGGDSELAASLSNLASRLQIEFDKYVEQVRIEAHGNT